MKWKDIIIGAFATLVVTILGGIGVYYFTKEPDEKKAEKLVYSVEQSASFTGGNQDLAFSTIKIQNRGGVAARQVAVTIFVKTAQIKDFAVDATAGSKEVAREVAPKSVTLKYETLLPNESITSNLMLSSAENPTVAVRSEASLGTESPLENDAVSKSGKVNQFSQRLVPFTGGLLTLLLLVLFISLRRTGFIESFYSSKNNTGFLLLHHGMIEDAVIVLNSAVHSGHYDAFTLSNLALCKAVNGDPDQANRLLRAANFRERSGHTRAVILFNEALISLISGNKDDAIVKLREAVSKSSTAIRRYCKHSVHLDAVRNDPAIYDIIKDV